MKKKIIPMPSFCLGMHQMNNESKAVTEQDKIKDLEAKNGEFEKEIADRDQYGDAYLWSLKFQKLDAKLQVAVEALEKSIEYFTPMHFKTCCNGQDCACLGMPTDQEYYILKYQQAALEKIKAK